MYKLAYGPMSLEVIKAIYKYSHDNNFPMMIIASKNQVDYDGGYVCSTQKSKEIFDSMQQQFPNADIMICRDHCGPGFKQGHDDLVTTKKTILTDIENGYKLIHIDLCHLPGSIQNKIDETCKLITFAQSLNPNIQFEIGTDENDGKPVYDLQQIESCLKQVLQYAQPRFYVVQTGSLVTDKNSGVFNSDSVKSVKTLLNQYRVGLKEHNADYLYDYQIQYRRGIVDAMNIAPQLGVIHTATVTSTCLIYGIDYKEWLWYTVSNLRWKRWTDNPDSHFKLLLAGHYHFNSPQYQEVINKLSKHTNIEQLIINNITSKIDFYRKHFYE